MSGDVVADFIAHLAAAGIQPIDPLIADGKLHRARLPGDKKPGSLSYKLNIDSPASGYYNAWKSGISGNWTQRIDRALSSDELARLRQEAEENRRRRDAETARARATAEKTAQREWEAAKPAQENHPYLVKKGTKEHGLRIAKDGRLVVPAYGAGGKIRTLQYIDAAGGKLFLKDGAIEGNYSSITDGSGRRDILLICEGWATGASLHEATGLPVVVAFNAGNLLPVAKVIREKYPAARLVICADNDLWKPEVGNVGRTKATAAAQAVGADLAVADVAGIEGKPTDFNDVAVARGLGAVLAQLNSVLHSAPPESQKPISAHPGELVMPSYPAPMGSVELARTATAEFIRRWTGTHDAYWESCPTGETLPPPPAFLLGAGVGVGKTRTALDVAVGLVEKARRIGTCGVIAVPRHALGDEQAASFKRLGAEKGLTVHVYRGRSADDPENPGEKMCRRSKEAEKLGAAGGSADSLCRRGRGEDAERCPFYEVCGTQRQSKVKADLHIVPHALLFHPKPDFILDPSWVIVDEDISQAALAGLDKLHPVRLSLDEATRSRRIPAGDGEDCGASDDYATARHRLELVLDGIEDGGRITRAALEEAGIDKDLALLARKLVYRCKAEVGVSPAMAESQTMPAIEAATKINGPIMRLARLWKLIAATLDAGADAVPGVRIETVPATDKTESYRAVRLRWRQDINESWTAPTLLMDATANVELVRPLFPSISTTLDAQPAWPNASIRQVSDWSASASHLIPKKEHEKPDTKDAATAKLNNIERVRRLIEVRAAEFRGRGALVDGKPLDVLVICQMGLEEQLRAGRGLPAGVEVAHFNAVAGADRWKGVACLMVIGRTLPPVAEVELMAEVLGGRPVEHIEGGRYPIRQGGIRIRGADAGIPLDTSYHPDPLADALRWQICEGQLIQAIGRARAVNRTAADPVQIDIITNVLLPVEVSEVAEWKVIREPHPLATMAARGFVLEEGRDLAAFSLGICPDLWGTAKAFERWREKGGLKPPNLNSKSIIEERGFEKWPLYRAHRDGARYAQTLRIDPSLYPDPRAALEAMVGKLKSFELILQPAASAPPAPPVSAGQALPPTQPHREPIAMTASAPIMFTVPGLVPATVRAAPGDVEPVTEFRIGRRPLVERSNILFAGLPGFGPTRHVDPQGPVDGCSDEIPAPCAPFDWGQADSWVEKFRRPPVPPIAPEVPEHAATA